MIKEWGRKRKEKQRSQSLLIAIANKNRAFFLSMSDLVRVCVCAHYG